jgi:hypothetical protein
LPLVVSASKFGAVSFIFKVIISSYFLRSFKIIKKG